MRLGTSSNFYTNRPLMESIPRCINVGFKNIDVNFCGINRENYFFDDINWREQIEYFKRLARENGVQFTQAHSQYFNVCDTTTANYGRLNEVAHLAIEACELLSVPWIVFHAGTSIEDGAYSYEKSLKDNFDYFTALLPFAKEHNVGIAIENLFDHSPNNLSNERKNFSADYREIITLCDMLSKEHDNVGICWDFGHAHIMKIDQCKALREIGNRLKATHVADNTGISDEHLLPFMGSVDWRRIIPVLRETGYEGDLSYEVHGMSINLIDDLVNVDFIAEYALKLGAVLTSI